MALSLTDLPTIMNQMSSFNPSLKNPSGFQVDYFQLKNLQQFDFK
jgi:hypothetical protein